MPPALPRRTLPLLLLGACSTRQALQAPSAAGSTDWASAPPLEILLEDYRFTPDRLPLKLRQPTRLVFVNRGSKTHDFTAPAFFAAAATPPGDAVAEAMRAAGGRVDVPAGERRSLTVLPLAAGSFPVECVKPLHAMFGMEGEIVVSA